MSLLASISLSGWIILGVLALCLAMLPRIWRGEGRVDVIPREDAADRNGPPPGTHEGTSGTGPPS